MQHIALIDFWLNGWRGTTSVNVDSSHPLFGSQALRLHTAGAVVQEGVQWTLPLSPLMSYVTSVFVYSIAGGEVMQLSVNSHHGSAVTLVPGYQRVWFSFTTGSGEISGLHSFLTVNTAAVDLIADGFQTEPGMVTPTAYIETVTGSVARLPGRVRADVSRVSTVEGTIVLSVVTEFDSTDSSVRTLYSVYKDASNYIRCYWDGAGHLVTETMDAGVSVQVYSDALVFSIGWNVVVVSTWTSSGPGISVNGLTLRTASGRVSAFTAPLTFDIGSHNGAQQLGGDIGWVAGLLRQASALDIAIWNGTNPAKPTLTSVGRESRLFFLWTGVDQTYQLVALT